MLTLFKAPPVKVSGYYKPACSLENLMVKGLTILNDQCSIILQSSKEL